MANLKEKPPAYQPGQRQISATGLNQTNDAVPRQITGGAGAGVTAVSDKVVVRQDPPTRPTAAKTALVRVVDEYENYLRCDRNGYDLLVAKPENLRGSTGHYEYGDQVLCTRLFSTGVVGRLGEVNIDIVWIDTGGKGINGEDGKDGTDGDDAYVTASDKDALDAKLPLDPPKRGYTTNNGREYKLQNGVWLPADFLVEGSV